MNQTHIALLQTLSRHSMKHVRYESLVTRLLNGEHLPQDADALDMLYVRLSVLQCLGLNA